MDTTTNTDPELAAAMARALDYTDAVGLSDGTDRPATAAAEVVRPARELDDDAIVSDLLDAMIGAGYEPAATVDIPDDVDANLGHRYDAIRLDRPGYTTAEWTLTGDGVGIIHHTDAAGYIVTRTQVDGLRYRHGLRTFITAAELRP